MTLSAFDMLLYAGTLFILFLTPGPVWIAVVARTLSGGFRAAWPLALGVVVGDIVWPLVAVLGVTWLVSMFADFMLILKWVAVAMFAVMGLLVFRHAGESLSGDSRLTSPGAWAGFAAGVVVILSNPKAVLFYMGVLPGFFDLTQVTVADITVIVILSMIVPFVGNMMLAAFIDRARRLLASGRALRRLNKAAGCLLIGVALLIAAT